MAKVKDKDIFGHQLIIGDLIVIPNKNDLCYGLAVKFMKGTILIQEVNNPEIVRRVKNCVYKSNGDVDSEITNKWLILRKEILENG